MIQRRADCIFSLDGYADSNSVNLYLLWAGLRNNVKSSNADQSSTAPFSRRLRQTEDTMIVF